MSRELVTRNKTDFDELHPRVYAIAAGLVAWFLLSAWVLFDHGGDVVLSLGFVTMLLVIAVVLPWGLYEIWRKYRVPYEVQLGVIPRLEKREFLGLGRQASRFPRRHRRAVAAGSRGFRADRDRHRVCDRERDLDLRRGSVSTN